MRLQIPIYNTRTYKDVALYVSDSHILRSKV